MTRPLHLFSYSLGYAKQNTASVRVSWTPGKGIKRAAPEDGGGLSGAVFSSLGGVPEKAQGVLHISAGVASVVQFYDMMAADPGQAVLQYQSQDGLLGFLVGLHGVASFRSIPLDGVNGALVDEIPFAPNYDGLETLSLYIFCKSLSSLLAPELLSHFVFLRASFI